MPHYRVEQVSMIEIYADDKEDALYRAREMFALGETDFESTSVDRID